MNDLIIEHTPDGVKITSKELYYQIQITKQDKLEILKHRGHKVEPHDFGKNVKEHHNRIEWQENIAPAVRIDNIVYRLDAAFDILVPSLGVEDLKHTAFIKIFTYEVEEPERLLKQSKLYQVCKMIYEQGQTAPDKLANMFGIAVMTNINEIYKPVGDEK